MPYVYALYVHKAHIYCLTHIRHTYKAHIYCLMSHRRHGRGGGDTVGKVILQNSFEQIEEHHAHEYVYSHKVGPGAGLERGLCLIYTYTYVFRVQGLGCRIWGLGFRLYGLGFWVSGFGFRLERGLCLAKLSEKSEKSTGDCST